MRETHSLLFAPFRLDLGAERLWRGAEARPLTRKAFAALRYLVAHAEQLVTKEELMAAVWAEPYVSDMAVAACIREIRRALDEQAQAPRFVETVRGRGYRFLAAVTVETHPVAVVGADGGGAGGVHPASLPTPRHNLPAPPTVFIGRETEVAEILGLLLEEPDCRLLTLVGPGGIGKTRLALRVAETLLATQTEHGTFAQGIVFVPLEAVPAASGIVIAILSVLAEANGFAIQATASLRVQLLDFLRTKALLLILDNAEHLVGEADVLATILSTAPGIKILVTSRIALNTQEEWFRPLAGLAYPQAGDTQGLAPAAYDAIRLFAHYARRARSDFSLAVEVEHVLRICRLVDGTPLALELAAAWLKGLPCQQVACELERGLDILTARHQNILVRHRSMRTVLEQSWRLLAQEEQQVLTRLSVFQGGFTQDAARVIASASPFTLTLLVEKSMVRMTTPGRYQMHELLRQFAAEHLQDAWPTHNASSRYFVTFAQQCYTCFLDKRYPEAIKNLSDERDNLRATWQWLMEQVQTEQQSACVLERLAAFVHPMAWFYRERALHWEGKAVFQAACTAIAAVLGQRAWPSAHAHKIRVLLARLQIRLAYFLYFLGEYAQVDQTLAAALPVAHASHLAAEEGIALETAARAHLRRGNYQATKTAAQRSLALARQAGNELQAIDALVLLARTAADEGDYDLAVRLHQQTVGFYRHLNYTAGMARALTNLGNTHILRRDYAVAQSLLETAHTLAQEHNNRFLVLFTGTNLGTVMLELGHYVEAAAYFRNNLVLAHEIGDQRRLALNLNYLSLTALHTHDLDGAQQHAQQALAVAHSMRCEPDVLSSISYLAHVWARQGNVEPALRILLYVDQHPAALARDKNFNTTLLTAWRESLAPEILTEAAAWGKTKQLDEVVSWLDGGWAYVSEVTPGPPTQ
jgi:predicted ATPase/DNA-binding winged helix-turn-helix (wHTH) protein